MHSLAQIKCNTWQTTYRQTTYTQTRTMEDSDLIYRMTALSTDAITHSRWKGARTLANLQVMIQPSKPKAPERKQIPCARASASSAILACMAASASRTFFMASLASLMWKVLPCSWSCSFCAFSYMLSQKCCQGLSLLGAMTFMHAYCKHIQ